MVNPAMRVLLMRNETKEIHNTEPVTLAVVQHFGTHKHQSDANSDRKMVQLFPCLRRFLSSADNLLQTELDPDRLPL